MPRLRVGCLPICQHSGQAFGELPLFHLRQALNYEVQLGDEEYELGNVGTLSLRYYSHMILAELAWA